VAGVATAAAAVAVVVAVTAGKYRFLAGPGAASPGRD